MYKIIATLMIIFLCGNILNIEVDAATISAATCSKADVDSAISTARTGDTVIIPSGTCSWATAVQIPIGKSITVQGQTKTFRNEATYQVTATDGTIIQTSGFSVGESNGVRITGITFDQTVTAIVIPKPAIGMRIDHCHFISVGRIWDKTVSANYQGILFDHNRILEPANEHMYINGAGNASWSSGGTCGNTNPEKTTWLEDNEWVYTSTGGHDTPIDSGNGARIVFRHNRFSGHVDRSWGLLFESHGHCWGQRDGADNASMYCFEISDNKFYLAKTGASSVILIKSRGGINYVYNNELYDLGWSPANVVSWWVQEVATACNNTPCAVAAHSIYHTVPLPAGWNCATYPCPMQFHDSYVWGNVWDRGTFNTAVRTDSVGYGLEDVDWWDDIGVGDTNFAKDIEANRPATCTINDSYWQTDNKKLFRCTNSNVWTLVYEAYQYPHPLSKPYPPRGLQLAQP